MPSKLKAGGTFPYILEADREDENPAVFHLKILSCLEHEELTSLRDDYFDKDAAGHRQLLDAMLLQSVESWSVPGHDQPQPLKAFLTAAECFELVAGAIRGTMLTADERKKLQSQHTSAVG